MLRSSTRRISSTRREEEEEEEEESWQQQYVYTQLHVHYIIAFSQTVFVYMYVATSLVPRLVPSLGTKVCWLHVLHVPHRDHKQLL